MKTPISLWGCSCLSMNYYIVYKVVYNTYMYISAAGIVHLDAESRTEKGDTHVHVHGSIATLQMQHQARCALSQFKLDTLASITG